MAASKNSSRGGGEHDIFDANVFKVLQNGKKIGKKTVRSVPIHRKVASTNGTKKNNTSKPDKRIAVNPDIDAETKENLNIESQSPVDMEVCKHCKKAVMKYTSKEHIAGCLKSKQEKARKKKEAREAAQRAKERAERADDDDDDDDAKGGKKRKTDGDDDKDSKKKKKKDEQKPKAAKPKGPVDVERQCGVTLPNGAQCARSLTCKSHSMGAKRAVPGRSLPYDMLLQAYQKKNQARQQKAAIDANAPLLFEDELDPALAGPVDSDEERDSVMTSISRSLARPQPIINHTLFPMRRKYQLVRMKEMLSNALSGNRSGGLFSVPVESARSAYPQSAIGDFAVQSAAASSATASASGMKAPPRKQSVDAT